VRHRCDSKLLIYKTYSEVYVFRCERAAGLRCAPLLAISAVESFTFVLRGDEARYIAARKRERLSAFLVQDDNGRPLTMLAMRGRFDKARKAAGVAFQFRDIRAKTASDTGDLGHSQRLLGHKNRDMTEHYVRERIGQRVKPLR
jgi:integrase